MKHTKPLYLDLVKIIDENLSTHFRNLEKTYRNYRTETRKTPEINSFMSSILCARYMENVYKKYYPAIDAFIQKHNIDKNIYIDTTKQLYLAIIIGIGRHYKHIEKQLYITTKKIHDIEYEDIEEKTPIKQDPYQTSITDKIYIEYEKLLEKNIELAKTPEKEENRPEDAIHQLLANVLYESNNILYIFLETLYQVTNKDIEKMIELYLLIYEQTKTGYKIDIQNFAEKVLSEQLTMPITPTLQTVLPQPKYFSDSQKTTTFLEPKTFQTSTMQPQSANTLQSANGSQSTKITMSANTPQSASVTKKWLQTCR